MPEGFHNACFGAVSQATILAIIGCVDNPNAGTLGATSGAMLLLSARILLGGIEVSFNDSARIPASGVPHARALLAGHMCAPR